MKTTIIATLVAGSSLLSVNTLADEAKAHTYQRDVHDVYDYTKKIPNTSAA